ncbi:MAG: hypothetical protein KDA87_22755 [Planctomycetales bacterium]|nr:hypothetical protein [Planctomycetales bacterium]
MSCIQTLLAQPSRVLSEYQIRVRLGICGVPRLPADVDVVIANSKCPCFAASQELARTRNVALVEMVADANSVAELDQMTADAVCLLGSTVSSLAAAIWNAHSSRHERTVLQREIQILEDQMVEFQLLSKAKAIAAELSGSPERQVLQQFRNMAAEQDVTLQDIATTITKMQDIFSFAAGRSKTPPAPGDA